MVVGNLAGVVVGLVVFRVIDTGTVTGMGLGLVAILAVGGLGLGPAAALAAELLAELAHAE